MQNMRNKLDSISIEMNMPQLFLNHKKFSEGGSKNIIKKYSYLLTQNEDESTALDIGSGPGNITHDVLLPSFKRPLKKIVGCDITKEMVDYSNANYSNKILTFEQFDIGSEAPEKYHLYFDYVVSFLTLQWIKDQRKLYSNIYKVLKPGGQILVSYIVRSTLFDIFSKVWSKPEYAPFITDFNKGRCFEDSKDFVEDLKEILQRTGFEVGMLKIEEVVLQDDTTANLREFVRSVNPVINDIPDYLKDKFMDDHVKEIDVIPGDSSSKNYYIKHYLFVLYAKKK